jgi:predicted dehydrogenase
MAAKRVGIVGCGRMAEKHLAVLSASPDFTVAGVCDVAADRRAAASHLAPEAMTFERHDEMYERAMLDLAVVATPPTCRTSPVIDALARRLPVLSEKPLAVELRAADAMVEAAARTGVPLAVHHQYRMSDALHRCRELISAGHIGEVVLLRGRGKAGRRAGIELLEIGTHLADTMSVLAGRPEWCAATVLEGGRLAQPDDVRRSTEVAPDETDFGDVMGTRIVANYGFANGVIGEMHFLGYEERMPENYGVDVLGTKGQLALRCSRHVATPLWHLPRPMEGGPAQLGDWRVVDVPGQGNEDLVEAFYAAMLRALRDGAPVPCTGRDGASALEMVLAAHRSHREGGRRVALPMPRSDDL